MRRKLVLALILALGAGSLGACASEEREPRGGAAPAPAESVRTAAGGVPEPAALDPTRAIILTASVSLHAADPWALSERIEVLASGLGGDVLSLAQTGAADDRSATIRIRVPADRFNEALRRIRALDAEVVSSAVASQDVTDQYVDLQARLAAKQAEERSYLALLQRAQTIEEVLKVDAALGTVRTQIEQLTGQINSIKAKTTYSTIAVSITMAPFGPNRVVRWDPAKSAADAFAALLAMAQVIGDVVIWLVVAGWLPALVVAGAVMIVRWLRRPASAG